MNFFTLYEYKKTSRPGVTRRGDPYIARAKLEFSL